MKSFVGLQAIGSKKGYSSIWIYEVTSKGLSYIGDLWYNMGSTRGAESEIMTRLAQLGYLPVKYFDPNLFYFSDNRNFSIQCYLPRKV